MAEPTKAETATEDHPLAKIEQEIQKEAQRLNRRPPTTAEAVGAEMTGTVMALLRDFAKATREQLEWQFESLAHAHERLDEMDSPETQFTPEDAEKFAFVLDGAIVVLEEVLAAGSSRPDDEKKKMQVLIDAAKECRQVVADETLEEGPDDDEDEEDDDSPDAAAN